MGVIGGISLDFFSSCIGPIGWQYANEKHHNSLNLNQIKATVFNLLQGFLLNEIYLVA